MYRLEDKTMGRGSQGNPYNVGVKEIKALTVNIVSDHGLHDPVDSQPMGVTGFCVFCIPLIFSL